MEEESAPEGPGPHTMQESWVEVGQQQQQHSPEEEEKEEGTVVHSHSREKMEQLLADAASEEELSDTDLLSSHYVQFTAQTTDRQVSERVQSLEQPQRIAAERAKPSSRLRVLSLRGSRLFGSEFLQLLFPVLVLTHLAVFGLGFYIGRRIALVKAI